MILLTFQFDFQIHDWQWLTIDEDYVKLDYAVVYGGNMFSVKARLLKPLDHVTVS